jgi:hypothetical protein
LKLPPSAVAVFLGHQNTVKLRSKKCFARACVCVRVDAYPMRVACAAILFVAGDISLVMLVFGR